MIWPAGFHYRFMQKICNIFEVLIKHNCETTASPLSDVTRQKHVFSSLVSSFKEAWLVAVLNFGRFISIATTALAAIIAK